MLVKPISAIAVLLLIIASLFVSGCATSSTSQTSSESSTATHNSFLEKYLEEYKNSTNKNFTIKTREITWINGTAARIEWTDVSKNTTTNHITTFMVFPTTQDATNYLNAMNKTAYILASRLYLGESYHRVTGHSPEVFKDYLWNEGDPSNISVYTHHDIQQIDNLIITYTEKILS